MIGMWNKVDFLNRNKNFSAHMTKKFYQMLIKLTIPDGKKAIISPHGNLKSTMKKSSNYLNKTSTYTLRSIFITTPILTIMHTHICKGRSLKMMLRELTIFTFTRSPKATKWIFPNKIISIFNLKLTLVAPRKISCAARTPVQMCAKIIK